MDASDLATGVLLIDVSSGKWYLVLEIDPIKIEVAVLKFRGPTTLESIRDLSLKYVEQYCRLHPKDQFRVDMETLLNE